jgi:hypothetical protein
MFLLTALSGLRVVVEDSAALSLVLQRVARRHSQTPSRRLHKNSD